MSVYIDPSQWRRQTTGGIPYKLLEGYPNGSFGKQTQFKESYIIRASDLLPFVSESFSSIHPTGAILNYVIGRSMPGVDGALTRQISFKPFGGGKPCDPFLVDVGAPEDTYNQFLEVSIDYDADPGDSGNGSGGDPADPTTFLEVSADVGVDFLTCKATANTYFISHSSYTSPVTGNSVVPGGHDQPADPNLPAAKIVPTIQWTVRFPNFPWQNLTTLLSRLRQYLGSVNSSAMPLFDNAPTETILFFGTTLRKQYQVMESGTEYKLSAMAQVEMKFSERRITSSIDPTLASDAILGHNHFYRPEVNSFELLQINDQDVYPSTNLNMLWT